MCTESDSAFSGLVTAVIFWMMLIRDVCSNHVKFDILLGCPCLFIREIQSASSPHPSKQQGDGFKL